MTPVTFGICSSPGSSVYLEKVISSIIEQGIQTFEIIIVGNVNLSMGDSKNIRIIEFDESIKPGWITAKKNLITKYAKYEIIVFLHDYIIFEKDWYQQIKNDLENSDILMCKILNFDGSRFRDWVLWVHNHEPFDLYLQTSRKGLLPYSEKSFSEFMYISGSFWISKKKVMEEFPLNEELVWGESEDVEWSKRVRKKYDFRMNELASVKLLKKKSPEFELCDPIFIQALGKYITSRNPDVFLDVFNA
jgi:glycosyltransferase involved in cell wall biosynthesis